MIHIHHSQDDPLFSVVLLDVRRLWHVHLSHRKLAAHHVDLVGDYDAWVRPADYAG